MCCTVQGRAVLLDGQCCSSRKRSARPLSDSSRGPSAPMRPDRSGLQLSPGCSIDWLHNKYAHEYIHRRRASGASDCEGEGPFPYQDILPLFNTGDNRYKKVLCTFDIRNRASFERSVLCCMTSITYELH